MSQSRDTAAAAPKRDTEALKADIVAAARKTFAARGYYAASTRNIASEAGVDVSTLYYHCGSKRDLFELVLRSIRAEFEEVIREWVRTSRPMDLDESVSAAATLFSEYIFAQPDVARIMLFSMLDYGSTEDATWDISTLKLLTQTLREYLSRRFGIDELPPEFDAAIIGVGTMIVAICGGQRYHGELLGLDRAELPKHAERLMRDNINTVAKQMGKFTTAPAHRGENHE